MKQVWILNHYAQEPGSAGGTRHFHLSQYLRNYGWQSTVIAASIEHGSGIQRLSPNELARYEKIEGVPFHWINVPPYSGNGAGRIVNMLSYSWRVLRRHTTAQLPRPDVIIGSSVHPFAAASAALIADRFNVPFVFEVRDLWPQTLIDVGRMSPKSPFTWVLKKLEKWLYRKASRIIVLLPRACDYIAPLGIPKKNIVWIPNGVDLSLFVQDQAAIDHQEKEDQEFTLMYLGAHGKANDLNNVLEAMQHVQRKNNNIRLRLIGDGPLKNQLMSFAQELGLTNVKFENPVPKSQIPELAAQADAFLISVLDLPQLYRYGISMNKLFDYMASNRPVIISSNAINNPVKEASAGLTVEAGNPAALADAILEMAAMPLAVRRQMAAAGRSYIEKNHGFNQLAGRLASTLDKVCVEHSRLSKDIMSSSGNFTR